VNPGDFVVAWPMLTKYNDDRYWAQVGWWEFAYDDRRTFVQWTDGPDSANTLWFPAQTVGTLTEYRVVYNPIPSLTFDFYVNQSVVATQWATFTPTQGQVYGEISSLANQMPGSVGQHELFGGNYVMYGNNWSAFNGVHAPGGQFGYYFGTTSLFEIWDPKCQS
jgi:hypothetical protein